MDYMDLDVLCPQKVDKLNFSLSLFPRGGLLMCRGIPDYTFDMIGKLRFISVGVQQAVHCELVSNGGGCHIDLSAWFSYG